MKKFESILKKNKIGIVFHAPGDNISLFSDYPLIREGIMKHFTEIVNAAEEIGARHITLHPGVYPAFKKANSGKDDFSKEYADYFSQVFYENILSLQENTKNTMLCIENYNFTDITMNVLDRILNDVPVFLTWDIAKTYDNQLNCNKQVEEFMLKNRNKIREIHAHDIIKGFRSHQTVTTGNIDFLKYHDIFMQPDIAITIEVRPREEATISKERLIEILSK